MLMASQQVFSAISRICIIGMGLLGVRPIGAGLYFCDLSKQKGKKNTKTKQNTQNKTKHTKQNKTHKTKQNEAT